MAIDPSIISTVRVDELPIAPITPESIIPHSIDGILYQGTISEVVALIPSATWKPYQVIILNVTDLYVDENFEINLTATSGLGKVGGLWQGWAIMNGNNGTTNMDDAIPLGYGVTRNNMREPVGENNKVLNKSQMPKMDLTLPTTDADNAGGTKLYVMANDQDQKPAATWTNAVNSTSPNSPVSIMQKSFVQLYIMKLP